MSAWTPVPKPTETTIVGQNADAEPWGLLLAITSVHGEPSSSVVTGWSNISKPTSSIWTMITKPTT